MIKSLFSEPSTWPLSFFIHWKALVTLDWWCYVKFLSINLMKKEILPECSFLLLSEELWHSGILFFWELTVYWELYSPCLSWSNASLLPGIRILSRLSILKSRQTHFQANRKQLRGSFLFRRWWARKRWSLSPSGNLGLQPVLTLTYGTNEESWMCLKTNAIYNTAYSL